jgi:hypothetical protein
MPTASGGNFAATFKVNQLRHARLLKDPDHVRIHMRRTGTRRPRRWW